MVQLEETKISSYLLTARQISEIFEIPKSMLLMWQGEGLITPHLPASYRGTVGLYSLKDIVKIMMVRDLAGLGLPPRYIKRFFEKAELWNGEYFFHSGEATILLEYDETYKLAKERIDAASG